MSNKSTDNIDESLNDPKETSKLNDTSNSVVSIESTQNSKKGVEMSIQEVFYLAKDFVKAKDGTKAIHLSYDDRNMIHVLTKQIHSRKLEDEQNKVGFLDLIGKDRLQLWKSIGDLSKEDAMKKYVEIIKKSCPLFHVHYEAHMRHLEEIEKQRLKLIEEEEQLRREMTEQKERKLREEDLKQFEDNKKRREDIQRKQIQEALNQQTLPHFKAYSEQQHPQNIQAQEELIKQLQEQHFEQYMNQVYQQQLVHQQQQAEQLRAMRRAQKKNDSNQLDENQFSQLSLNSPATLNETPHQNSLPENTDSNLNINTLNATEINLNDSSKNNQLTNDIKKTEDKPETSSQNEKSLSLINGSQGECEENNEEDDESELPPISAASMLTRKDLKEFKESVRKDNDAIIKVGSGETVTVRVPTHDDGRLIFWEFSTDFYDLGFGLYFEWTLSPSSNVTVHVSDSSDEEDGDEEDPNKQDLEVGDKATENKPPCDEIIPIFRRDCHEEVYAGSHLYPGRGVYLLKFDNSYSLWRSKTLYYRVYYSK